MCIYFSNREKARAFKSKNGKMVDLGKDAAPGKRWAFRIAKSK